MKTIYSAIQPSGDFTIGNYFGTLKNWKEYTDDCDCLFCIADLHAITVFQNPKDLRERSIKLAAIYLALGLDPEKCIIYLQSSVSEHTKMHWLLSSLTSLGQLNRMHQFKSKIKGNVENANAALYCYPILMAADILLYQTHLVPVGEDQKQHVEVTRDFAQKFNSKYEEVFVLPEPLIGKTGAKIKSLQDPTKKMSKSDTNEFASILLLDDKKAIEKKIKRAVTDSVGKINYSDDQPGIKNLLNIYSLITNKNIEEIVDYFSDKGYGILKSELIESIDETLKPIRDKYSYYMQNQEYIFEILEKGREKAQTRAEKTLKKVEDCIGFL